MPPGVFLPAPNGDPPLDEPNLLRPPLLDVKVGRAGRDKLVLMADAPPRGTSRSSCSRSSSSSSSSSVSVSETSCSVSVPERLVVVSYSELELVTRARSFPVPPAPAAAPRDPPLDDGRATVYEARRGKVFIRCCTVGREGPFDIPSAGAGTLARLLKGAAGGAAFVADGALPPTPGDPAMDVGAVDMLAWLVPLEAMEALESLDDVAVYAGALLIGAIDDAEGSSAGAGPKSNGTPVAIATGMVLEVTFESVGGTCVALSLACPDADPLVLASVATEFPAEPCCVCWLALKLEDEGDVAASDDAMPAPLPCDMDPRFLVKRLFTLEKPAAAAPAAPSPLPPLPPLWCVSRVEERCRAAPLPSFCSLTRSLLPLSIS